MIISGLFALLLQNAFQAFKILLQVGAGTGLLFILRWFWWRISAISEITAMIVSFLVAVYFEFIHLGLGFPPLEDWQKFIWGVTITTAAWMLVTLFSKPTDRKTLLHFYQLINPGGPGWRFFLEKAGAEGKSLLKNSDKKWEVPGSLLNIFLGCMAIYSAIFSVGFWLYSNEGPAIVTTITSAAAAVGLILNWGRLKTTVSHTDTDTP